MTAEEILSELKILKKRWEGHVEHTWSDDPEDWGLARGIESGYEYAAYELDDVIKKIESE